MFILSKRGTASTQTKEKNMKISKMTKSQKRDMDTLAIEWNRKKEGEDLTQDVCNELLSFNTEAMEILNYI